MRLMRPAIWADSVVSSPAAIRAAISLSATGLAAALGAGVGAAAGAAGAMLPPCPCAPA